MPPRIVPKAYLDVQFLRKMIETYKPRLRTVNGRDPLVWWNEFIERIQREQDAMCPTCLGCLKKLASLKLLHKDPQKKEKRKQKSSAQQVWRKHLDECKLVAAAEFGPLIHRRDQMQPQPAVSASTSLSDVLEEFVLQDSGLPQVYKRNKLPAKLRERPASIKVNDLGRSWCKARASGKSPELRGSS